MAEFKVTPTVRPLRGTIRVPADKSISHRAAILGALAAGVTRVDNFLQSETTSATLNCLHGLGAEIKADSSGLVIHGKGLHSLVEPQNILFCAGSGTTMRLLAGVCAGQGFLTVLDGTAALKRRPMARVIEPLAGMGAAILARDGNRLPPLAIRGANLRGIEYSMPVASAQVKSAILLAGLFADGTTIVKEPSLSRDHTERMLRAFGVTIESRESNYITSLQPSTALKSPQSIVIPNDFSSAAFLVVAALLAAHSEICIERVGVNSTRTGFVDALARMGAEIKFENAREESGEPIADLVVSGSSGLRATDVSGADVPRMIDEFPIFAVVATQARGESVVRDAQELRVKESDRIGTLAQELRKMGARIEERADGFAIEGPTELRGARVQAHHDHRLAMSLAVAGLVARGETVIEGWECVADSFPNFEQVLFQ